MANGPCWEMRRRFERDGKEGRGLYCLKNGWGWLFTGNAAPEWESAESASLVGDTRAIDVRSRDNGEGALVRPRTDAVSV